MPKERIPEDVYDELATQGMYEEAHLDRDEVTKIKNLAMEDYEFGRTLRNLKNPNWRVIFNINYDALRELCDQLMRFKKQKISNHQGLFAFIILNFQELDLDWQFFEMIRSVRNKNKYLGTDISKETWKRIELQIDLYITAIKGKIEELLRQH